jgi:hypothetical protein
MRTTLSIDDDVIAAAKELATRQGKTVGKVISDLVRQALSVKRPKTRSRSGIRLLPLQPGAKRVTTEVVIQLFDDLEQ